MVRNLLKMLIGAAIVAVISGVLFMLFSSQFGAKASKGDLERFQQSEYFLGKTFHNLTPTNMGMETGSTWSTLKQFIKGNPNKTPPKGIVKALSVTAEALNNPESESRILWFGHSTFLLQHKGKNFLFDPVFSDVPSPVPWLGTPRYSGDLPISPDL